jgi:GDP-4-dehydro-6-deoxy-D-mannose reductase
MRVLITGVAGFVGRHLVDACRRGGAEIVGVGRSAIDDDLRGRLDEYAIVDLDDADAITDAVRAATPERVFHLAGQASVVESWSAPGATIAGNVMTTMNLLEAVRREAPAARVLVACSGEQYGPVPVERLPVIEDEPLRPQNPYAVSKAAVDLLSGFYADAHDLQIVRARAFNHCGPGQGDAYVVAALASQIASAEAAGQATATISTGDLRPRRDFTDVRDVVAAYWLAAAAAVPGAYNVCRGRSTPIADILAMLDGHTQLEINQQTDPQRKRSHEVMDIRGSNEKLVAATGWQPRIPLEQTMSDTLDWWRARVAVLTGR